MLQQTRVETVIPFYERFLRSFPTVNALALADEEDVLKHWEGLGYYRRVLLLHRAARQLHTEGRAVPVLAAELRELPGIGAYTAHAIASIAGGEAVAAVDGNVARVVARLIGLRADILSARGKRAVQQVADALLSRRRAGDFNQAWMDLGSKVCTPRSPTCKECPLSRYCAAHAHGTTAELPRRGTMRARSVPTIQCVAAHVRDDRGRVLVRRRPSGGLWSGLWEFPFVEVGANEAAAEALRALERQIGGTLKGSRQVERVQHQLTHRLMHFDVSAGSWQRAARSSKRIGEYRWVDETELQALAMGTVQRKIQRAVAQARMKTI